VCELLWLSVAAEAGQGEEPMSTGRAHSPPGLFSDHSTSVLESRSHRPERRIRGGGHLSCDAVRLAKWTVDRKSSSVSGGGARLLWGFGIGFLGDDWPSCRVAGSRLSGRIRES
jgi:hypothetical protein